MGFVGLPLFASLAYVSAGMIAFTVLNLDKSVNDANNKGAGDGLFGNHENPS